MKNKQSFSTNKQILNAPEEIFHLGIKAIIKNKKGEILVLEANPKKHQKYKYKHWDLPGGRIHKNSTIDQTLKRELEEEIGVKDIKIKKFVDASISKHRVNFKNGSSVGLILFTFLCSVKENEEIKIIDEEHLSFKWVSPKEAAKLLTDKFSDSLIEKIKTL